MHLLIALLKVAIWSCVLLPSFGTNNFHNTSSADYYNARRNIYCKELTRELALPVRLKAVRKNRYGEWYMNFWDSMWSCPLEQNIQSISPGGMRGDGAKWVCDAKFIPRNNCLVYSFGKNLGFPLLRLLAYYLFINLFIFIRIPGRFFF